MLSVSAQFGTQQYEWLIGTQYKSMELSKSDWSAIRKSPPWALDSWGLGKYVFWTLEFALWLYVNKRF